MASRKTFPPTVVVTREELNEGESYLQIHEDGVHDTDFETTTEVAVYKLDFVGTVVVDRRLEGPIRKVKKA